MFFSIRAQNLIPNPSFENHNACDVNYASSPIYNTYGSVNPYPAAPTVKQWYNNVAGTTDYFNVCAPAVVAGNQLTHVPDNFTGRQYPHTGNAYMGAILWSSESGVGAEYFSSKLSSPMVAGHQYHLSFWVSLAETNRPGGINIPGSSCYGINSIGAHFSQNEIVSGPLTTVLSNLSADIVSAPNVFYTDTVNWVKIEGTYTATGGEEWMTIGNFHPYATQQKVLVAPLISAGSQAYYYFDDFCLKDVASASKNAFNKTGCDSVTISGNMAATMWAWSTGDTSKTIKATQSGTYWVQSFANCQIYVDTFHVSILPKGTPFDLGADISHCGDTTILLGPAISTFTSYLWSNGATTKNISVNVSGTYYVTANSACNSFSDTIRVGINPVPPKPNDFDTFMCHQANTNYRIPVHGQNLFWVNTVTGIGSPTQPIVDLTIDNNYNFNVFGVSDKGCISAPANVSISVHGEAPQVTLQDTATCMTSINIGTQLGKVGYKWSTGDTTCCINVNRTGIYLLTVANECGQSTAQSKVNIMHCNSCLSVPSAFTPNGDALNDVYLVQTACLLGRFQISIYNRYGQRVFNATNINEGWDGTFKGKPCDAGTYFYYIEADPSFESKQIILKGDITLIK